LRSLKIKHTIPERSDQIGRRKALDRASPGTGHRAMKEVVDVDGN